MDGQTRKISDDITYYPGHFLWRSIIMTIYGHFLYNLYIFFFWLQHCHLANIVFSSDPSKSVIKRLWCMFFSMEEKEKY